MYYKEDIEVQVLAELYIDNFETLWLKVKIDGKSVIFGVCYRSPGSLNDEIEYFMNCLYATLDSITDKYGGCPLIIVGDFNDRCTAWDSDHSDSDLGSQLRDLTDSFNLYQLVDESTRGENLLDLLFTNNVSFVSRCVVCDPFDNLDHCPILGSMNLNYKISHNYKRTIRSFNDTNIDELKTNLARVPWFALFEPDADCNEVNYVFSQILNDELNNCIPVKEVLIRVKDKPDMTSAVRNLFRKCHRLHKNAQRTKNQLDIELHMPKEHGDWLKENTKINCMYKWQTLLHVTSATGNLLRVCLIQNILEFQVLFLMVDVIIHQLISVKFSMNILYHRQL